MHHRIGRWRRAGIAGLLATLTLGAVGLGATPASAGGVHGPEPWPGYYDEYEGKYHYLLYNPETHLGNAHGPHGHGGHDDGGHDHGGTDDGHTDDGGHDHTDGSHDHGTMIDGADDPTVTDAPDTDGMMDGGAMGGGHHAGPEDDCLLNPPTHEQIRAANDFAVTAAKWIEDYPIFVNHDQATKILPKMGFQFSFEIPGFGWIWDLAGRHWISLANSFDGEVAVPDKPENLIYLQTARGYQPIGTMYTSGGESGPDFGGCLTMWHIHTNEGAIGEALGWMTHVFTFGQDEGPFFEPACEWYEMRKCIDPYEDPLDHPIYPWWVWW